jgi:hypothetical protein
MHTLTVSHSIGSLIRTKPPYFKYVDEFQEYKLKTKITLLLFLDLFYRSGMQITPRKLFLNIWKVIKYNTNIQNMCL